MPYMLLIYKWEGIVPPLTQSENPNTITNFSRVSNFYIVNLGYACTLVAFYLLPLLFFKKKNLIEIIKIKKKKLFNLYNTFNLHIFSSSKLRF